MCPCLECATAQRIASIGTTVRSFRRDTAGERRTIKTMKRRPRSIDTPLGLLPRPAPNGARRGAAKRVSLALVQFAPRKGDVDANIAAIGDAFAALDRDKALFPDVVVFPEACLSGYFVEGGVRDVALSAAEAVKRLHAVAKARV